MRKDRKLEAPGRWAGQERWMRRGVSRGEVQRTKRVPRRPPGGRRTDGEMTQVGAPTMTPKRSRTEAEDEEGAPIRVGYGGVSQGAAAAAAAT